MSGSKTRVVIPVDEQRVREIVREELRVSNKADVEGAFQRLAAFRDRYTDDNALIDASSGLTVADLDTLLLRLHRMRNINMVPVLDQVEREIFARRSGAE